MHVRRVLKLVALAAAVISGVIAFAAAPAAAATPLTRGDVLTGIGSSKVEEYAPSGTFVQTLNDTTGSLFTTGMCQDSSQNLYVTNFSAGNISKFSPGGTLLSATWATAGTSPESCVFDRAGNMYVGHASAAGIKKFSSAGGTATQTFAVPTASDWIELASDQCTMLYHQEVSDIKRWNICTDAAMTDLANGRTGPCFALRFRANGEILVGCSTAAYRLDAAGNVIQTYLASGMGSGGDTSLFALNLDPDGTTFWTASQSSQKVHRLNIASGATLITFNGSQTGSSIFGLAVYGEVTAALATSPSPSATATAQPGLPSAGSDAASRGNGGPAVVAVILVLGLMAAVATVREGRRRGRSAVR